MASSSAPARQPVTLSRDAVGHRSLFWARTPDGRVVSGPRLKEVLRDSGLPRRVNPRAVATYLAFSYLPGEETLAEGVFAVPPGCTVRIAPDGSHTTTTDWSLPPEPAEFAPEAALEGELRATLAGTIGEAVAGAPAVAAFLSGGIDSSLVLAHARQRTPAPILALSVSFGEGHANELAWSRRVAAHVGVPQEVVLVTPEDVRATFDATVGALSEPNGDPLTVPNTLLFRAAAQRGAAVVINGEGGDPCFGGPKNAPMLLSELYGGGGRGEAYLLAHQRCYEDLDALLTPSVPSDHLLPLLAPWMESPRWPSFLNRLMAVNIVFKGAWHILPKVEHLGLAEGVEARSPLFSREIVELSTRIPASLKRAGAVEKYLLKRAVADLLPEDVVNRPKSGMMVPVEAWFSGPLLPWARERLLDGLAGRGLVQRAWLEDLLGRRLGGLRPRRGIKIWQLLTLEAWLRCVLEGA